MLPTESIHTRQEIMGCSLGGGLCGCCRTVICYFLVVLSSLNLQRTVYYGDISYIVVRAWSVLYLRLHFMYIVDYLLGVCDLEYNLDLLPWYLVVIRNSLISASLLKQISSFISKDT